MYRFQGSRDFFLGKPELLAPYFRIDNPGSSEGQTHSLQVERLQPRLTQQGD
jgi:hypothetical protein